MSTDLVRVLSQDRFDELGITTLSYKGQPVWFAKEVGRALGYADDARRFVRDITTDWAEEIGEGEDAFRVPREEQPEDLRQLFGGAESATPNSRGGHRGEVILLTERGVWTATLLSRREPGRCLRRWLASEVLPKLARGLAVGGAAGDIEARLSRLERIAAAWPTGPQVGQPSLALPAPGSAGLRMDRPELNPEADPWLPGVRAALVGAEQTTIGTVLLALGPKVWKGKDRLDSNRVSRLLRHLGWRRALKSRVHTAPHHGEPANVWRPLIQA